jgi:lipopolysaccharide export system protein LptA
MTPRPKRPNSSAARRVKSGLDEVRGQFISYDARSEQYVVTSGANGTKAPSGSRERVRAVIQPRNKDVAGGHGRR